MNSLYHFPTTYLNFLEWILENSSIFTFNVLHWWFWMLLKLCLIGIQTLNHIFQEEYFFEIIILDLVQILSLQHSCIQLHQSSCPIHFQIHTLKRWWRSFPFFVHILIDFSCFTMQLLTLKVIGLLNSGNKCRNTPYNVFLQRHGGFQEGGVTIRHSPYCSDMRHMLVIC